jgi:hypothetical protein
VYRWIDDNILFLAFGVPAIGVAVASALSVASCRSRRSAAS